MGMYFKHFAERNFMLFILHGSVNGRDVDSQVTESLQEKYAQAGMARLIILCKGASASDLSYHDIFSAGKRMKKAAFRKGGKLAIVAQTPLGFGLAKVYQAASRVDGLDEIRVLRSAKLTAAIQWLEVSEYSEKITQKVNQLEQDSTDSDFIIKIR